MNYNFSSLKKNSEESNIEYSKRISDLSVIHVGYAYFSTDGYDERRHVYGSYIVWNGAFNSCLYEPLNEYGYVIHCSKDIAYELLIKCSGIPVYAKLSVDHGQLCVKSFYLEHNERKYIVSYIGLSVHKPDNVYFKNIDDINNDYDANTVMEAGSFNLSSFSIGSYNVSSFNVGSFNASSFNVGSFSLSSFNVGSYNVSSFNIGSYNISSFNVGSFNVSSFNIGFFINSSYNVTSFNLSGFNLSSFNIGSYNISSFTIGSYNIASFINGSFSINGFLLGSFSVGSFNTSSFNLSSFNLSSFNLSSFNIGSFSLTENNVLFEDITYHHMPITTLSPNEFTMDRFYLDIYGIGCLGYGLNLI